MTSYMWNTTRLYDAEALAKMTNTARLHDATVRDSVSRQSSYTRNTARLLTAEGLASTSYSRNTSMHSN